MSSPDIGELERKLVLEVLNGPYLSNGPRTPEFERTFAAYVGSAHAIAVSSGTGGLHMCVVTAGVGAGDLVITSPFSFVASANVILYQGGVPVFVDVEETTGNMDLDALREAAAALERGGRARSEWLPPSEREGASTGSFKAVVPVHVFGEPLDCEVVGNVARQQGASVIEDACEALGAAGRGGKAGASGDAGVFAFYPNKQMTTGEGGMIVTDRDDWAEAFKSLRNQGRDVFDEWLTHSRLGFNYRMDEMSAALGVAQLQRIDELLGKREQVARWYEERLSGVEGVATPRVTAGSVTKSWFVYVIRLQDANHRARVMEGLSQRGVPSRPYFTPIHLQKVYVERFGYRRGMFPVSEALGDVSLALPFSGVMSEDQVDYVCEQLRSL